MSLSGNLLDLKTKTLILPGMYLPKKSNMVVYETAHVGNGITKTDYLKIDAQVIWFKAPTLLLDQGVFEAALIIFDNFKSDCRNLTFKASVVEFRNMSQEKIDEIQRKVTGINGQIRYIFTAAKTDSDPKLLFYLQ